MYLWSLIINEFFFLNYNFRILTSTDDGQKKREKQTNKHCVMYWARIIVKINKTLIDNDIINFNSFQSLIQIAWLQFAQSCPTPCKSGCRTPGFPVHHQLTEPTQTHLHHVGDAIQPSHPLSPPFPPAFNLPQHQGLLQWVSSLRHMAKVLEFQL